MGVGCQSSSLSVVPHLNCGQVAKSVGCRKPTELVQDSSHQKTVEGLSPESPANVSGCLLRSGNSKQMNSLKKGQFTLFNKLSRNEVGQYRGKIKQVVGALRHVLTATDVEDPCFQERPTSCSTRSTPPKRMI